MAETAKRTELLDPFLDQGIRDINFFNGRLLAAGDLTTLQDASRRRDYQLGLGIGAGVVQGLEVRLLSDGSDGQPPVLAVAKGLAFNALGQAVALPQNVEVQLSKEKPASASNGKMAFEICMPPQQNGKPVPGKGAYVFVARPISGYQGQAPRRGFGQAAKVEGCDRDALLEGVQFRLVSLDVTTLTTLPQATRNQVTQLIQDADKSDPVGLPAQSKLRNWLAHLCAGTEELATWPRDLLNSLADDFFGAAVRSPFDTYGALDALQTAGLLDHCDVPLALVLWTATGVKWVDRWAVRRRPTAALNARRFPLLTSDRWAAETEAMMQQFQEQAQEMQLDLSLNLTTVQVGDRFRYLPPAGLLPLAGSGAARGFAYDTFFTGMTVRQPSFIEGAQVRPLLQEAIYYPPLDTAGPVVVWLYIVRENAQALLTLSQPPPGYMVFASGHMPYRGEARYDVHHWNFANVS